MIAAETASAAAIAAQATTSAYIAAILQGLEYEADTPITGMNLKGATGTITLEIANAKTEGRTKEDRKLD